MGDFDGGWQPDVHTVAHANLTRFTDWLRDTGRGDFGDYSSLWGASVSDVGWFWQAIWDFFDVRSVQRPTVALAEERMPGAVWFPGTSLNYAAQVLRHAPSAASMRR